MATMSVVTLVAYALVWQSQGVVHSTVRGLHGSTDSLASYHNVSAHHNGTIRIVPQRFSIELPVDCQPIEADHLVWWQVYSELTPELELLNAHNKHFLPDDAELWFLDHHCGMLEYARKLSIILEKCSKFKIRGFYEAVADIRAVTTRTNMVRAALLWNYGGVWADHKIVLFQNLSSFIDLTSDNVVLPRDYWDSRAVQTSFMYSRKPRQEVFEHIILLQIQNVQKRYYPTINSFWQFGYGKVCQLTGSKRVCDLIDQDRLDPGLSPALFTTGPGCYGIAVMYYLGNVSKPTLDRSLQLQVATGNSMLFNGGEFEFHHPFIKGSHDDTSIINNMLSMFPKLHSPPSWGGDVSKITVAWHWGLKVERGGTPGYSDLFWKHQLYCDDPADDDVFCGQDCLDDA